MTLFDRQDPGCLPTSWSLSGTRYSARRTLMISKSWNRTACLESQSVYKVANPRRFWFLIPRASINVEANGRKMTRCFVRRNPNVIGQRCYSYRRSTIVKQASIGLDNITASSTQSVCRFAHREELKNVVSDPRLPPEPVTWVSLQGEVL